MNKLPLLYSLTFTVLAWAATAGAQTTLPPAAVPPVNVLLPNGNGVPAGETGSLEGGAFLVRANDASSAFYNPAGLALAERTSISGSAGVFQIDSVSPEHFTKAGSSFQQIPAMVGFVMKNLFHDEQWSGGFGITRTNAWNQSLGAHGTGTVGNATQSASYVGDALFSGWIMNMGVGFTNKKKNLRVGGSLDIQYTNAEKYESVGEQLQGATGLTALLVGANAWSSTDHLRMTVGTQYDVTPSLHVGAVFRTPGLAFYRSGSYTLEGMSHVGPVTTSATFFDDAGEVNYKIPLDFNVGAAWVGKRVEIEFDVLTRSGAGTYQGFSSNQPLTILTDQGSGGPVIVQNVPLTPKVVDSQTVVNFVVGGHVRLTENGTWRVHAGWGTDFSPVGPSDTIFTPIDLQNWTLGFSGRAKFVVASLGLRTETGTSGLVPIRTGGDTQTRFKVLNVGLVYSVSVLF